MPKGNMINMTPEEANEREAARKMLRDMYKATVDSGKGFTVKADKVVPFWNAISIVWPNLTATGERSTMSEAEKIANHVATATEPVSDFDLFVEYRVATNDVRRYLVHKAEAGCAPYSKVDGKDTYFAYACTDEQVAALAADGYSEIVLSKRGRKKQDG